MANRIFNKIASMLRPSVPQVITKETQTTVIRGSTEGDAAYWSRDSRVPFARYDGAFQMWGDRSWIWSSVQDARFDLDPATRLELVRRARYWEQNNPIACRLGGLFAQFTVGPNGFRVVPNAGGDEDGEVDNEDSQNWNKSSANYWANWSHRPDRCSLRTLSELEHVLAVRWFFDGEIFIHKTSEKVPSKQNKNRLIDVPRIQLIESHRVGTPSDKKHLEGKTIFDGVEVDDAGKPIFYWVRKASMEMVASQIGTSLIPSYTMQQSQPEDWDRIPAANIIHIFEPSRPGMYRGVSFLFAVMNDLHDLDDLQFAEMKAAKAAADLAVIFITKTGEAPQSTSFRNLRQNVQTQDNAGNVTTKANHLWYDMTSGGRDKYLKPGEKAEMFESNRPSVATQAYWDYLVSKICAGVGISKLLVMPYSNQGTVVRSDLDTNFVFFRSRSAVLARAVRDLYVWVIGWAKDYDPALDGAPDDWSRVIIRPPRSITVDVGRNSTAVLNELEAGTRTFADVYAESGEDWKEQLEQRAKEAAFINELAARYKVPREQIAAPPKPPVTPPPPGATKGQQATAVVKEQEPVYA